MGGKINQEVHLKERNLHGVKVLMTAIVMPNRVLPDSFSSLAKRLDLPFCLTPGVEVSGLEDLPQPMLEDFRLLHSRLPLTGEIGCLRAHQNAQELLLGDPDSDWILIFEEDARVLDEAGIRTILSQLGGLDLIPHIILLSYEESTVLARASSSKDFSYTLVPPLLASAYLINRAAVSLAQKHRDDVDLADWPWWLSGVKFAVSNRRSVSTDNNLKSAIGPRPVIEGSFLARAISRVRFVMRRTELGGWADFSSAIQRALTTPFVYFLLQFALSKKILTLMRLHVY